jgi:hypothetical protein
MSLTRQQLLIHVHPPLQSTARRSSPTKPTYRIRWREICEWTDFVIEAQTYWDGLDDAEKNQMIQTPSNYWDVLEAGLMAAMPSVSRERHLLTPFALKYCVSHNHAVSGARDDHASITIGIPDTIIGQPDACFVYDDNISGIIEIKPFWNLTNESIVQVIQDISPPSHR